MHTIGAIFHSFGARLCTEKGDITVKSDAVRQALDFYKKLMQFLPGDVAAWDDASNNKFLISGQALAGRAYVQAQKFGARMLIPMEVRRLVCKSGEPMMLELGDGREVRTRTVEDRQRSGTASFRSKAPAAGGSTKVNAFPTLTPTSHPPSRHSATRCRCCCAPNPAARDVTSSSATR